MDAKPDDSVGYDYTLRPILFLVPAGSAEGLSKGGKREAEALRAASRAAKRG